MTTAPPPLIGALLRITHEAVRQQVLADVRAAGFELSSAEFAVMQYPGPDGLRPIDLAKQCNVSKQGVNYLLAGLMERGYIERIDDIRVLRSTDPRIAAQMLDLAPYRPVSSQPAIERDLSIAIAAHTTRDNRRRARRRSSVRESGRACLRR